MALYMLEASIAWDKSIMKAVSLTTARNSVCAKLRNRCVSLKATNQYKQLLTTSQTSVGIRTNLLTESSFTAPVPIPNNTLCLPSSVRWLTERVRRFEWISTGVYLIWWPNLNDTLLIATVLSQYIRFQFHSKILMYIVTCAKNMAMKFAYIRWISLCSRDTLILHLS